MLCIFFLLLPIESSHVALLQRTQDSTHYLNLLEHLPREQLYAGDLEDGGLSKNKNTTELYILLGFYVTAENQCGQGRVDKDFERLCHVGIVISRLKEVWEIIPCMGGM